MRRIRMKAALLVGVAAVVAGIATASVVDPGSAPQRATVAAGPSSPVTADDVTWG